MTMLQEMFSDSISYAQFKLAVASMEMESYRVVDDPSFKPALILGATSLTISYMFMTYKGGDKQLLIHQTTIIFIVGGALSILTYFIQ